MNVTLTMAWRNLWRNGRRTWLTIAAMIFTNVLLVFLISLQLGMYDTMIENSLRAFSGQMQVQREGYLDEPRMRETIAGSSAITAMLREQLGIESITQRAQGFALASSQERSFGIQLIGVEPAYEPLVSSLPGLLGEGRWLSDSNAEEIVLGRVLARNLQVQLGDEITLLGSGADGSFAAGLATVVGILDTGLPDADRSIAQLPLGTFQSIFSMPDQAHALVFEFPDLNQVPARKSQVETLLSKKQLLAQFQLAVHDWDALQPGLRQAIMSDMVSAWFMYGILIIVVSLSVMNTQLMSVLERTREFGIMLALGIKPGRLGRLVLLETLIMSLLGMFIGIFIGYLLVAWFAHTGFTFAGMAEAAAKYNMDEYMYPQASLLSLFWGPGTVFIGGMLAAIYPALKLQRMHPIEAMRAV
ncbi:ABC transporter permease [Halieaceae bacterium IMCC14734]|uniref:ABC transporter permease n=1 Tax=Candidatus Litorirhabdus singularis TaxID=2518993 RepID=A0ABT3TBB9_9GAMM|nr:FtsX-like permease family protein [Candidatus Litorirhabdus singularis]MCX2979555.1 ABC transporter permease [Candidatus Litorirhabdus singularis]